jgi:protein-disulfide isomerase
MQQPVPHLLARVSAVDHVLGPQVAPVTVVEYGDFECPRCRQAASAVKLLLAHFDQRVRFVFRHFPLEETHASALAAAEAAECAGAQGKFWPMHELLFEHQLQLGLARIFDLARSLDLEMARFTAEMNDRAHLQRVREDQRSGEYSGVRATPTFFVNGRILDVSYAMRSLSEAVDSALQRSVADELPAADTPAQVAPSMSSFHR